MSRAPASRIVALVLAFTAGCAHRSGTPDGQHRHLCCGSVWTAVQHDAADTGAGDHALCALVAPPTVLAHGAIAAIATPFLAVLTVATLPVAAVEGKLPEWRQGLREPWGRLGAMAAGVEPQCRR